jgi:type I restriction enzyme, S subunit
VLSKRRHRKAIHRLRPLSDDVLPEFYLFWMEWAFRVANIYGVTGTQTTIAHLPQEKLEELQIPVPTISEQRAIAQVLQTVQRGAEVRQRELGLERERKAALMEHLFTHGTRGGKIKQTEIGEIPEGWAIEILGDVAQQMQYGLSLRGSADGAVPILRMSNLIKGRVDAPDLQRVSIGADLLRSFSVRKGELLFNRTNSQGLVGKTAIFSLEGTYVFASYLIRIRIDESKADSMFVNAYLNRESVLRRVRGLATRGVSQSNISASKLARFRIPIPPQDEQRAIASVFAGCDLKIRALQREITVAEELFGTMLEGLMTGRLTPVSIEVGRQ